MNPAETIGVNRRARILLTIVIVLLTVLFIGLVVMFVNLLTPRGLPDESDLPPSNQLEWVRSIYGFGPAADQQLKAPGAVAIGPNGDIYAADPQRARVMVFNPDGTFVKLIHTAGGGVAKGQFMRPVAIDVDDDGNVFIADGIAKKVIQFDADGAFVREFPADTQARGVTVSDGRVYLLDLGKVIVFDADGKRVDEFGTRGPMPGQIDASLGIVVNDGRVYIADALNKRLQRFSADGGVDWVVPDGAAPRGVSTKQVGRPDGSGSGSAPNHLWGLPQDAVFDGAGRLVVIDAFGFDIAVADPKTGKVEATYGEFGGSDGEFYYPTSIAYDQRRDWFAVADTNNNRIQIVRIPESGDPLAGIVWRAYASPYRYLAIPLFLLLGALAVSLWAFRRAQAAPALETADGDDPAA